MFDLLAPRRSSSLNSSKSLAIEAELYQISSLKHSNIVDIETEEQAQQAADEWLAMELEEEKLRKKLESKQKELQKAKAEDLESKSSNVFKGDGNKLSDVSNNMSREEIRLARLKFLEKKNKNKENSNKDLDV